MSASTETAAVVAVLRLGRRTPQATSELIENAGSALAVLVRDLAENHGQTSLLTPDPEPLLQQAADELDGWAQAGLHVLTLLDPDYPENLRAVHDRPPLIFHAGRLRASDRRAIAVIGSRRASTAGLTASAAIAEQLVSDGYTVVSGLAAGIDTAAHTAALAAGGRTVAVIGTGLEHRYPPENAALQDRLAREGAVISQFWPDARPTRGSFPRRNAVMSGLALASVIVEASATSGARIQARRALAHGRPVFLRRQVLDEPWGRELARRPGTYVFDSHDQVTAVVDGLRQPGALIG